MAFLSLFTYCNKCKSIGSSSAPEAAIIDNDSLSQYFNQNVGYLKFDIQQNKNDDGECGKFAAVVSYVIHNNTNKTMHINYIVDFSSITTPWYKSDDVIIPPFGSINKTNFNDIGADYTNAVITITPISITYQ